MEPKSNAAAQPCPWRCPTCADHHENACPTMWGGAFVPAPCGHSEQQ